MSRAFASALLVVVVGAAGACAQSGPVFATPVHDGVPWSVNALALGDLDGDGRLDAVATHTATSTNRTVYRGDGDGGFTTTALLASVPYPRQVELHDHDLDGGGALDAIVVGQNPGVWSYAGDGAGALLPPAIAATAGPPAEFSPSPTSTRTELRTWSSPLLTAGGCPAPGELLRLELDLAFGPTTGLLLLGGGPAATPVVSSPEGARRDRRTRVVQPSTSLHASSANPTSQVRPTLAAGARRVPEGPSTLLAIASKSNPFSLGSKTTNRRPRAATIRSAPANTFFRSSLAKRAFFASTISTTSMPFRPTNSSARAHPVQCLRW